MSSPRNSIDLTGGTISDGSDGKRELTVADAAREIRNRVLSPDRGGNRRSQSVREKKSSVCYFVFFLIVNRLAPL
jgi:hypothetical protein